MTGSRPGIFIDPLLHEKSRLGVYEVRQHLGVVDPRRTRKQPVPSGTERVAKLPKLVQHVLGPTFDQSL